MLMELLLAHGLTAIMSWYISYCANKDLPWLKMNLWLAFFIGLIFGYVGAVGIAFYMFYKIAKKHGYSK